MSNRKGLSQILYLIIAASVLMMIAMVITFTATDTIGNLGSSSSEDQCVSTLQGQCGVTSSDATAVPSSCFSSDRNNLVTNQIASSNIYQNEDLTGSPSGAYDSPPYYIACDNVP